MSQLRKSLDKSRPPEAVVLAGAVAGTCEVATTYPLDTVKTHMQVYPARYRTMTSAAVGVMEVSGLRGLFFGLPASMAQVGGKVALRFSAYDRIRNALRDDQGRISHTNNLFAGLAAGSVEAVLWTTPTERIKILQQDSATRAGEAPLSSFATLSRLVRQQGWSALYLGTVATVVKQSCSVGVRFWLYEWMREWLMSNRGEVRFVDTLAVGALVGGVSAGVNHPVDVVKSRMQADRGDGKYRGMLQGLRVIVREDGWAAVMKGLSPRLARVAVAQAVTFSVYETVLGAYCSMRSP